ncbi:MAG: hypothetical protein CMP83_10445, partial [Gammaproteobacteria bacterium]|nr:hypothetical protein [Gammaproteobacteria bacterium]
IIKNDENFNDVLNENNFNEELNLPIKSAKSKKKKSLDSESTDLLAAENNIKIIDDNENIILNQNLSINSKKKKVSKNKVLDNFIDTKDIDKNKKRLLNSEKEFSDNKLVTNNFENSKNTYFGMASNKSMNISKPNKKSKIKSLFQNYFNYTSKKYSKKNINLKKLNFETARNQEKLHLKEIFINENTLNIKIEDNKTFINENINKVNSENINKEHNNVGDHTIKFSSEKNTINQKETSLENFDRLKNILDIQSNDIKQRFAQIIENNIKVNNNKFEIHLRPENLGKIQITLEITGQNVDININSDNISTIQILTENNSNLQKMLQNHGMNLNNFNFNGNNNRESSKDLNKLSKQENKSDAINVDENSNNEDHFVSNKLVYVKA